MNRKASRRARKARELALLVEEGAWALAEERAKSLRIAQELNAEDAAALRRHPIRAECLIDTTSLMTGRTFIKVEHVPTGQRIELDGVGHQGDLEDRAFDKLEAALQELELPEEES